MLSLHVCKKILRKICFSFFKKLPLFIEWPLCVCVCVCVCVYIYIYIYMVCIVCDWVKIFAILWLFAVQKLHDQSSSHHKKVPAVVGSVVVFGVLICCALLHSVWDLKAAQMNMWHSLIQELMLHKFELRHNATDATQNFSCVKRKGIVDDSTVTWWFKKFCLDCKNLSNQASPKSMDSEAMHQSIGSHLVSSIRRVSGELSLSFINVVHCLYNLCKSIIAAKVCFTLPKCSKTFDSPSYVHQ